ncbi:MAG TPA: hypothetical protein VMG40_06230 [Bryobacteraceae bacterium]|nr:hypothetical protein [Bryobacteraceae bacterium]
MKPNLESLREEIESCLLERGLAAFHGAPFDYDDAPTVLWDMARDPDYRAFLAAAEAAGVRLIALHAEQFDEELIDDALERLEDARLAASRRAEIERRFRELRRYDGFTCRIELSFDHPPRVYVFDLRTEWFEELGDLLDEIEESEGEEGPPESPGAGYFSKN